MVRRSEMTPERRQRVAAQMAAWKEANPDKVRAYNHKYDTSEKRKEYSRLYKKAQKAKAPEAFLAQNRSRGAEYRRRKKEEDPVGYAQARREVQRRYAAKHPDVERERVRARYLRKRPLTDAKAKDLLSLLQRGIPQHIPDDIRDDVANELFLGLLEGKITRSTVGREIRAYVTAQYRHLDHHRLLSLDCPIPGMDGQNWVDALEAGVERF